MQNRNSMMMSGAALGNCVHVAGVANFLRAAQGVGYQTRLLGAAVGVDRILSHVETQRPNFLAVSYRLTPENAEPLLRDLMKGMERFPDTKILFGGTARVVEVARKIGGFEAYFVGEEPPRDVSRFLRVQLGERIDASEQTKTQDPLAELLQRGPKADFDAPLIRHHFGLPTLERTIEGVRRIAMSGVVDVISLATDQNAQEFFFRPHTMDPRLDGAGGVPVRKPEDLRAIWTASQCGNRPRLRTYSGTQDLFDWAEMSIAQIDQAWGTVPLTWYSELDGRSRRPIAEAISENKRVMALYAKRGIPVEVNEAHHWSLREAPDAVAVAMAYVAAYNARAAGVRDFFAQYMFNTPVYTSQWNDLAKMTAKAQIIESLADGRFTPYRQMRAGLTHFSNDLSVAKGQLAQSTNTILAMRPHILHVVGFSEASHAAEPEDVIESVKIAQGVLRNARVGAAGLVPDLKLKSTVRRLVDEAALVLGAMQALGRNMGAADPLAEPAVIARAINIGLVDAPHLAGQECALGAVATMPIDGGSQAVDADTGRPISEEDRVSSIMRKTGIAWTPYVFPPLDVTAS